MRFSYAISYESDTLPIETARGELTATSAKSAAVKAARAVRQHWPPHRTFRSWVITIERLDDAADAA